MGVQEDDLDVEDDEHHGGQVVLDRELASADGLGGGFDAALVGVDLGPVVALGPGQRRHRDREQREEGGESCQRQQGQVDVHTILRSIGIILGTTQPECRATSSSTPALVNRFTSVSLLARRDNAVRPPAAGLTGALSGAHTARARCRATIPPVRFRYRTSVHPDRAMSWASPFWSGQARMDSAR